MTWFGTAMIEGIALRDDGHVIAVIRHPSGATIVADHSGEARTGVRGWPLVRGVLLSLLGAFHDVAPMEWSIDRVGEDPPDGAFVRERLPLAAPRGAGKQAWAVAYLVIAILLPQILADGLLRAAGVSIPLRAATFHVAVAVIFVTLLLAYSALIARAADVRRTLEFNAVLIRTIAAHEIDEAVTPDGLRRRASFHPLSSANSLVIAAGLTTIATILAGHAGWPSDEGRFTSHVALAAFKIALLPLVFGLTHEIQLALSRCYRVRALRRPIEWLFVLQRVWVREPSDAQLALGYIAAQEVAGRDGAVFPPSGEAPVGGAGSGFHF